MANWKNKVAQRTATLMATAEYSDKAVNELADMDAKNQIIAKIEEASAEVEKLYASAGVQREFKQPSRWEYGPTVGALGRFLALWTYLPETQKKLFSKEIPVHAFTVHDYEQWGKLQSCTPLGEIKEWLQSDVEDVSRQVTLLKAFLDLPIGAEVDHLYSIPTQEQWEALRDKSIKTAKLKADKLSAAFAEELAKSTAGESSFLVPNFKA